MKVVHPGLRCEGASPTRKREPVNAVRRETAVDHGSVDAGAAAERMLAAGLQQVV
jgi:hypothetical protein